MSSTQINNNKKKKETNSSFKYLLLPWILVILSLIILPIIVMFLYSTFILIDGVFLGFTLNNYLEIILNSVYLETIFISILFALTATITTILIGYPFAYFMSQLPNNKINRRLFWILVTMPIWINMLIRVIAMKSFFKIFMPFLYSSSFGIEVMVISTMAYIFFPFMVLPIYNHLNERNRTLEEAARDLGASQIKTFWTIILPGSIPSIIAGVIMVFFPAITTITISFIISDGSIILIGNVFENLFINGNNYEIGSALAFIVLFIMVLLLLLLRLIENIFTKDKTITLKNQVVENEINQNEKVS